ncbi:hypothetical protein ACFQ44_04620 [Levilactobacillus lanxiensis]|uniref:D-alanyl-D-alanine carboxypeptidase n=1 Tax=Levilactobacillus lanxiensis TaxID=2799568 RepID=A0ABW4D2G6_9LACO|nr:hypothetical protein [Levilactobacillus lanxiensis]
MNKLLKVSAITALTFSLGAVIVPSTTLSASAKTKAAKVLKSKKMKKTAYHAKGGYIYSSTKLTKKSFKAFKHLKTTFYATKSVTVKKSNGKTATYYYIKNSKGSIKGYIWKGNLKKINTKNLAQRKADIKHVLAAIRTMKSSGPKGIALSAMGTVTTSNTYDINDGLSGALHFMHGDYIEDGQAAMQVYESFKGRFDSVTNAKLAAFNDAVADVVADTNEGEDNFSLYLATEDLTDNLANAVADLH